MIWLNGIMKHAFFFESIILLLIWYFFYQVNHHQRISLASENKALLYVIILMLSFLLCHLSFSLYLSFSMWHKFFSFVWFVVSLWREKLIVSQWSKTGMLAVWKQIVNSIVLQCAGMQLLALVFKTSAHVLRRKNQCLISYRIYL